MKKCIRCDETKPLMEFNRLSRSRDGHQNHCRACTSAYYYGNAAAHKKGVKARNTRIRMEHAQRAWDYLLAHPCVDCGETDPVVLDFDHVRGRKKNSVSIMISQSFSWTTIMEEIAKCDIRCANCHRRRTATQLGWYAKIMR